MRKIRIFFSSPGDVGEERSISQRVVERLRFRYAARLEIEALFWEHLPILATQSYQDQIPNAGEFDVVVMILWSRMGTRLHEELVRDDGTRYESGTEFEFEQALTAARRRGLPELLVYRKTARVTVDLSSADDDLLERTRQKRAVDGFIDRWFRSPDGSFRAAFHGFETSSQFEDLIERHLRTLVDAKVAAGPAGSRAQTPKLWEGSPFRGLERFEFEHGMLYFGRTAAANDVLNALRHQSAAGKPFVLIFGKSGVGKSSFARAGALPLLCDPGVIEGVRYWRRAIFEPSDSTGDSLDGLAASLFTKTALPELAELTTESELASLLRTSPAHAIPIVRGALSAAAKGAGVDPGAARLALVIDPLEEIFSRPGAAHDDRERFVAALEALAGSGIVWTLATMRSDFYERCGELPALLALKSGSGQYHLAPPTSAEIGRMIRSPAQLVGLSFEEDDVEGPLDEVLKEAALGDPAGLPLLQFALDEIYLRSNAVETGVLTFAACRELGGIHGAVRTRAEETYAAAKTVLGERMDAAFADVFSQLVSVNQVTEHSVVRRYAYLERIRADEDRKTLVDALVEARLFMTDIDDENRPVVTLAHEALLNHWPRLRSWIEGNRDFLRTHVRVADAARLWRAERGESAYLLSEGKPLAEAEDLILQHRAALSPETIEFIEASSAAVRAAHARARRRSRQAFTVVTTAFVAASIFGVVSFFQYREAAAQREAARSQEESAVARARSGQALIEFLLEDLRDSLAPDNARDAELIAKISAQVIAHFERLDSERDSPEVKLEHADNLLGVSKIFVKMAKYKEAAEVAQLSLNLREAVALAEDQRLPEALEVLGACRNQLGDYSEAEKLFQRAIEESERRFGTSDARLAIANGRLAELYRHLGRYADSERLHRRAIAVAELSLEPDDPALAMRYNDFGELLRNRHKLAEAEDHLRKALAIVRTEPIRDRRQAAEVEGNLGVLLADLGRLPEAEATLRRILEMDVQSVGEDNPVVAADRYKLARALILRGGEADLERADELLVASARVLTATYGEDHLRTAKCFEAYADLRSEQRRFDDALTFARKTLAVRRRILTEPHPEIVKTLEQLARIERLAGGEAAATALAEEAKAMGDRYARQEAAAEGLLAGAK